MSLDTAAFESLAAEVLDDWQDCIGRVTAAHGDAFLINPRNDQPCGLNPFFLPALLSESCPTLHDATTRTLYRYDEHTGLWQPQTDDLMRRLLAELAHDFCRAAGHEQIGMRARQHAQLVGALNNLRSLVDTRFEDRPGGIVHCRNGMLDVASGELLPFSPEFKSRNASPFDWDESATCRRFLDELLGAALDADDIRLIQLYCGLALMGRNLSQRLLLLTGTPGGGKSQLCVVIEGLIGPTNCTQLRTQLLHERFELARMVGKTLLTGKDVPGDFLMTKGAHVLKALCGGDALTTEIKGKMGSDTLAGEFAVLITSNSHLRVRLDGDTVAWRRRLLMVKYERPKTESPVPDFGRSLLAAEGAGILRWAVEGARQLLALNWQFPVTAGQQARVDSLLDESNALRSFIGSAIVAEKGGSLTVAEIVQRFFDFCEGRGWTAGSVGTVERELADVMLELHRVVKSNSIERPGERTQKGFRGVKWSDFCENGTLGTGDSNPNVWDFADPYSNGTGKKASQPSQTALWDSEDY